MSDAILLELRAIRDEQLAQGKLLARVDERTLSLDEKMDRHISDDENFHSDIEKRIRPIERFKIRAATIIAFAAFIGGAIIDFAKEAVAMAWHH